MWVGKELQCWLVGKERVEKVYWVFLIVMLKGNDCVSYIHRGQAALRLDCMIMLVKGNEYVSYLNRGQAAARLDCCIESNTLALTFIDVKLSLRLNLCTLENKRAPQCTRGYSAPSGTDESTSGNGRLAKVRQIERLGDVILICAVFLYNFNTFHLY